MPSGPPPGLSETSPLGRLLAQVGELIEQERFADAIPPMREVAALQPHHARVHADLGGLYVEAGRHAEALDPLRKAISLNPRVAIAHWRLGEALQALGETDSAMTALEHAVQIRLDLADAHLRLAQIYLGKGRDRDAAAAFRLAGQSIGDAAERQLLEAQALMAERSEEQAERLLVSALALRPDLPTAHGLLATILAAAGRFTEASRHYEAQLSRTPRAGLCYYDLVRSRKIAEKDEPLVRRMAVLAEQDIDDLNRSLVELARAKALDDLGRYEEAMMALDASSDFRARAFSIDVHQFERRVDGIVAMFDAQTLARARSHSSDSKPLLLLGLPRSGTTLTEQIVSSHPMIAGGGERSFWRTRLQAVLESSAGPDAAFLEESASDYLDVLHKISPDAARVTDKDPFNFLAVGLIHMAFPRARIVHCRRMLVDTALSIRHTFFSKSTGLPTGSTDLVRYIRAYQRLMAHWRQVLPQGRLYELEYEKLTAWPRIEIPRLIEHIGVGWDDACLSPHVNTRMVNTPSGWQVRQSINTGSVGRWRLYEPWLGPLAALLEEETNA